MYVPHLCDNVFTTRYKCFNCTDQQIFVLSLIIGSRFTACCFSVCLWQELADERLVELQMLVQCASQVEAEIQVLLKQLQDLQTSMCKTNQQKEEVKLRHASHVCKGFWLEQTVMESSSYKFCDTLSYRGNSVFMNGFSPCFHHHKLTNDVSLLTKH